jgi:hypothetical protein
METNIQTVGIDIGASALKIYTEAAGAMIPAQVAVKSRELINQALFGIASDESPALIEANGWAYWCGPNAHGWGEAIEAFSHDRFDTVPTRALVYTALTLVGQAGINSPIRLVLGLPQGVATGEGADARLAAIRKWLIDDGGEHKWVASGTRQRARIAEVLLTSQPRGALVDVITDTNGTVTAQGRNLYKGRVGVISIGFNTLELMMMDGGQPQPFLDKGEKLGVRKLLETINTNHRRTAGQMDADLRKGRLNLDDQLAGYWQRIQLHIDEAWGDQWKEWDGIIAVGGGSILLRDQLRSTFGGRLVAVEDPVLSTARGLYRLGLQQARKAVSIAKASK